MTISFKSRTDAGSPTFVRDDTDYTIVCEPGDRGRWLGDYLDPLTPGDELTFLAQARNSAAEEVCSSLILIWWANEPGYVVHSRIHIGEICGAMDDFKHFIHKFTVPEGVKSLRVDLRSWSGPGTAMFKDIAIVQAEEPPPPPPPDDKMLTIDLGLDTTIWRVTASAESITALHIPKEPETATTIRREENNMDDDLQVELLYFARRIALRYWAYIDRGDPHFVGLDNALEKAYTTNIGNLVLLRELKNEDRSLPQPLKLDR